MHFDLITIFPEFFAGPLDYGIVRRARESGLIDVDVHDLRTFTRDRHRTVDDRPFGGGEGMVLKPEPIFEAVESLLRKSIVGAQHDLYRQVSAGRNDGTDSSAIPPLGTAIVLLSASGKLFRQDAARRFASLEQIILICGRYEGVDERVAEQLATDELSIGDFVLSGGELGAALILDAVTRLLPGALGNEDSAVNESFSAPSGNAGTNQNGTAFPTVKSHPSGGNAESQITNHVLLDYPHYTRPAEYRGWPVPEILLGGNHEQIRRWRLQKAWEKTRRNRPDLLSPEISFE